jgi:integrase
VVRRTLSGIARDLGSHPRQVAPLRLAALRAMLEATPEDDLLAVRDRAILLLGFAGGMRRSEISTLDVTDLSFVDQGVDILLRKSKTDQEGHGRTIGIPKGRHPETCPVIALQRWLFLAALEQAGPLFPRIVPNGRPASRRPDNKGTLAKGRLSPQGIARVVQRAVARIGLDPKDFAGHSLRSGFATEAAAQGASERAIMRQTGHKSLEMVRRYIREGDRYRDNAASYLGL